MHYNPRIHYTYGGELRHVWSGRGRKPIALGGAPNGFSNDPNRRPTGKKAVGTRKVLPNGQVIYVGYNNQYTDTGTGSPFGNYKPPKGGKSGMGPIDYKAVQKKINDTIANQDKNFATVKTINGSGQKKTKASKPGYNRVNSYTDSGSGNQQRTTKAQQVAAKAEADRRYNNSLIGRIDNATKGIRSTISNAAGNASRGVGNWLNERRRNIETAWDGQAGKGSAKDQANQYARSGNNAASRDAQDRYNRSIKGRMESAGNWLTERFGAAKKAVGESVESARRFAENVPGNLKRAGESVRNAVSNRDEREAYEKARDNLKKNNSAENRKAYDEAKSAYQNHALTKAGRAINDAKNSVGLAARNTVTNARNTATRIAKEAPGNIERALKDARTSVGKAWDGKAGNGSAKEDQKAYSRYGQRAAKAGNRKDTDKWAKAASASGQDYQRSIKGTAERLAKNAGETARNVGGRVSETAGRLAKNAGETARGVGSKVSETAKGVSEAATTAVNKTIATANYKKAERKLDSLEKKMQKAADKDVNSLEYQRAEREFYAYRDGEYRAAQREFNRYKNK